jgi:dienelactone hydrolase
MRLLASAAVALAFAVAAAAPARAATYRGTISFRGADPSGVTVTFGKRTAAVALGPGHAAHSVVGVSRRANRVRFAVPGRPKPLVFALRAAGRRFVGTAKQANARATVSLRRGRPGADASLGFFTGAGGPFLVMRTARGFTSPVAIDLQSGVFGSRHSGSRMPVRQEEVRFRSGAVTIAGTLTLPPGPGPFPAAVYVSGSGRTLRDEAQFLGGALVAGGIAVLGYDKRGVGQSGGVFPGELATADAISTYANDAGAAARFLAAQPDIDKRRVGFYGLSQGGWIIPVAAARAPTAISWALIQGGPTVTQGEADYYGSIAGSWTGPLTDAEAQARRHGPSGFDPMPWIRQLALPMLWLYGGDDRAEPPHTSIALLQGLMSESPRDFTIRLYGDAPHPLFSSAGFAAGLFADVRAWLGEHGLTP